MAIITEIKLQAKNKERVNVYLDDNFFCGLELETVMKHQLKEGQTIEVEKLEVIQFESEKQVAFQKSLNLISRYVKTKKQMKDYLKQKGYTTSVIEYVIKKLEEYNYINDEVYAKTYVTLNAKTSGIKKLRQDLMVKGVEKSLVEKALNELDDQADFIKKLAEKYMNNKEKNKKNYAKLYAYLMRRGFTYEQIEPFLRVTGEEE